MIRLLRIPKLALPIVKIIRRDVPRPDGVPSLFKERHPGTKSNGVLRWRGSTGGWCCPMGLHPLANSNAPVSTESFPVAGCGSENIKVFGNWWDSLVKVRAAMDAVWGKRS